jgi:hypothetical protein
MSHQWVGRLHHCGTTCTCAAGPALMVESGIPWLADGTKRQLLGPFWLRLRLSKRWAQRYVVNVTTEKRAILAVSAKIHRLGMGETRINPYSGMACSDDNEWYPVLERFVMLFLTRLPKREQTGAAACKGLERHQQRV